MEYRYILYTDGQKSETCSNNLDWIKEFIDKIFNPNDTIFNKKRSLCEVLDTKTNTIAYSMTLEQWKKENSKDEVIEEFSDEELKSIKSLEKALKKCSNAKLKFYTKGDCVFAYKKGSDEEIGINTSSTFEL
jgi:hypothetical protein